MADDHRRFLGRRRELADISKLVRRARLVTLTGVSGVGKTQLALRVAQRVQPSFPDGVWLVSLADLEDENLVAPTVAATLGLREAALGLQQAQPEGREPSDMLVDYLADKRLLLVLDGCEHVLGACAALTETLLRRASRLCVLATSRQALGLFGETIRVVAPLSTPPVNEPVPVQDLPRYEAVRLFTTRAAAAAPGFDLTVDNCLTVMRLCQRMEGIPLALELAAARLKTLPLARILDPPTATVADEPNDAETEPLEVTLNGSLALCSAAERLLWARLSVFSGGFQLDAAEQACTGDGIEQQDVLTLVAELVDKSILTMEGTGPRSRYRMLEAIREYGGRLLTKAGEEVAQRQRHRDYYLRLTEQVRADWMSPRQLEWFARLQDEHANLRAALEFCFSHPGSQDTALALAGGLGRYWLASSGLTEGRYWLDQALQLSAEPSHAMAMALWVNGWLAILQGDTTHGLALLDRSRAIAQQTGDDEALRRAIQFSGLAALFQGEFAKALPLFEEALSRHRQAGDLDGSWLALYQLAITTTHLGDTERALAYGEECLALCDAQEARWSRSYALWVTGSIHWWQGDTERAATLARDSLRLRYSFGDVWGTTLCLEVLSWIATSDQHYENAATLQGACHQLWQAIGTSPTRISYLANAHQACEQQTRTALGEDVFTDLLHQGAQLPTERMVATALEPLPAAQPPARQQRHRA